MMVTQPSNNLPWIVSEALSGGVNMVQWRQKSGLGSGFNRAYAGVCAVVQDAAPLVVNTAWDRAQKLPIVNIHLPAKSATIAAARKIVGSRGLVGKSVHSVDEANKAEEDGADYIFAGTVFASASHPDIEPKGPALLEHLRHAITIPIIAIGGITAENLPVCINAGASGVAVLSPFFQTKQPCEVAKQYRTALEAAWITRYEVTN
jgi:thiamine-phosphate pyrophosphorylase